MEGVRCCLALGQCAAWQKARSRTVHEIVLEERDGREGIALWCHLPPLQGDRDGKRTCAAAQIAANLPTG